MNTAPNELITFCASPEDEGERLDRFLASKIEGTTRSRLKDLIKAGHVRRQDLVVSSPNARIKQGDVYNIDMPPPSAPEPKPQNIPLTIVYEDDDLIVINKPAGMVVHPATGHWHGTLVNALLYHCGDSLSGIGGVKRPGIVHRLDRHTSGLMVVAKNDKAHKGLSDQLAAREVTRLYQALVLGVPMPIKGKVDQPIGRHPSNRLKMAINAQNGRDAVTHYKVMEKYRDEFSLLECKLETGRTHQIRLHLASLRSPVLCDKLYAGHSQLPSADCRTRCRSPQLAKERLPDEILLKRQALHAHRISFKHPISDKPMQSCAPMPEDMQQVLLVLRQVPAKG